MNHLALGLPVLLSLAAVLLPAQGVQQLTSASAQRAVRSDPDVFKVPIHDEAMLAGRSGGVWAMGASYKVSFHDGMRFYPLLGSTYPQNLPLGWTTTSVTSGGVELLSSAAARQTWRDEWRMEYRLGAVTEAYDVRPEGVEQTFVLDRRPASPGDLAIRGRVDTPLHASAFGPAHGAVVFTDAAGKSIVSYGAATAVDALGNRMPMQTQLEGDEVTLLLDGGWIETATFPVTVDPLVASASIAPTSAETIEFGSIAHDAETDEIIVVLTRIFSSGDTDIMGINYLPSFSFPITVFVNVIDFSIVRNPAVAFVGGASKWITAFELELVGSPTPHKIAYHMHDTGDLLMDTSAFILAQPANTSRRNPDVGGTRAFSSSARALIVFEEEWGTTTNANTSSTRIRADRLDLSLNSVLGSVYVTALASSLDTEHPTVNQESLGGSSPWVVAWQERDPTIANDDWDIRAAFMRPNSGLTTYAPTPLDQLSPGRHSVSPQIAGSGGRYMVTYNSLPGTSSSTATTATEIRATQFNWPIASADLSLRSDFQARLAAVPLVNVDLAFDTTTEGHWASISHTQNPVFGARSITVQRLVGDGAAETIFEGGTFDLMTGYGVTYDAISDRFPIFYTGPAGNQLRGTFLVHPPTLVPNAFGVACGPATIGSSGQPLAGNQHFSVTLSGAAPVGFAGGLLISFAPGALSLDLLGFTGCFANIDLAAPNYLGLVPVMTTPGGTSIELALPPSLDGHLYMQWIYRVPGLNPSDFAFTAGLDIDVVR